MKTNNSKAIKAFRKQYEDMKNGQGCVAPNTICSFGDKVFYGTILITSSPNDRNTTKKRKKI